MWVAQGRGEAYTTGPEWPPGPAWAPGPERTLCYTPGRFGAQIRTTSL
jgi:hypothetical protein